MYHVPLSLQCVYGRSDERGESGEREDGSEISGFCVASWNKT